MNEDKEIREEDIMDILGVPRNEVEEEKRFVEANALTWEQVIDSMQQGLSR